MILELSVKYPAIFIFLCLPRYQNGLSELPTPKANMFFETSPVQPISRLSESASDSDKVRIRDVYIYILYVYIIYIAIYSFLYTSLTYREIIYQAFESIFHSFLSNNFTLE